jgi:hypothetical protein
MRGILNLNNVSYFVEHRWFAVYTHIIIFFA